MARPDQDGTGRPIQIFYARPESIKDLDVKFWHKLDSSLKIVIIQFWIAIFDTLKTVIFGIIEITAVFLSQLLTEREISNSDDRKDLVQINESQLYLTLRNYFFINKNQLLGKIMEKFRSYLFSNYFQSSAVL